MGSVASVTFSPDGTLLATCGSSFDDYARVFDEVERLDELSTGPGRLKIWDVKTGALKHDLVGHSDANAVAFSPDGSALASAGSWLSDTETGTGVIMWNPQTGTKVRTIVTAANGGTHSVAFSLDGKLVAINSLHFDVDKANDAGTCAITLAHAASGVVSWRRTFPGLARRVIFEHGDFVFALMYGGQSIECLDFRTGETLFAVSRTRDPQDKGRWTDFGIAKRGRMRVTSGEDAEKKGYVDVFDADER